MSKSESKSDYLSIRSGPDPPCFSRGFEPFASLLKGVIEVGRAVLHLTQPKPENLTSTAELCLMRAKASGFGLRPCPSSQLNFFFFWYYPASVDNVNPIHMESNPPREISIDTINNVVS